MKFMNKKYIVLILIPAVLVIAGWYCIMHCNLDRNYSVGQAIDSLNGVIVYYNGGVENEAGRNISKDDYNIGIKYQCVEFVKRYYYEHLNHKMPESHGNAKDFYDKAVGDGELNIKRNLIQYSNPSKSKPKADDLLVLKGTLFNKYGHVAIVANVSENEIELIQQNPGVFKKSRERIGLANKDGKWLIDNQRVLGWLRKE